MGVQFGAYATDQGTPDANFGAAVDGNYGFGDGCFNGTLDATDPSAPTCSRAATSRHGARRGRLPRPHRPRRQDGRQRQADLQGHQGRGHQHRERRQLRSPGPAAGLRRPAAPGGRRRLRHRRLRAISAPVPHAGGNGVPVGATVPASTPIDNATFRRHRRPRPTRARRGRCATPSSSTLQNGKSIVPMFNVFTDVPLPGPLLRPTTSTTSPSPPTRSRCSTVRRPASRSARSASTTSPTA